MLEFVRSNSVCEAGGIWPDSAMAFGRLSAERTVVSAASPCCSHKCVAAAVRFGGVADIVAAFLSVAHGAGSVRLFAEGFR